ncbi:MAG: family 78 glycoside hydrolase catalytic domain [Clostridia bacterium]|nr:family 78 glycoside hydrolase catalytic domain [Clostridia bacterium]
MIKKAKWICCGPEPELPIVEKEFFCEGGKIKKAKIEITGLGFFQCYLNGHLITEDMMIPCYSDYMDRDFSRAVFPVRDHAHHRVYYLEYDLLPYIREGRNLLEVMLGDGWFRQKERIAEGVLMYGDRLMTLFSVEVQSENGDMEVHSDGTERYRRSFITYSQLFVGEVHDARISHEKPDYYPVKLCKKPDGELTRQTCPADRIQQTILPDKVAELEDRTIYDVGENVSAIPIIHTTAPAGTVIKLQFAENINEDKTLSFGSSGGNHTCSSGRKQIQEDVFICDGTARTFIPRFVWHAFRYFSVEGEGKPLVAIVHAQMPRNAYFRSDSEGLNYLYQTFQRTQLNNMHAGVPSDCPHRERLGYTGDGQVSCEAAMLLFEGKYFYKKWLQDILDAQDPVTGHVPHTAPYQGGGGGPAGWGGAIVEVSYRYWRRYGDRDMLKKAYPKMKLFVQYMVHHSRDDLVVSEEEGGWCLGDWAGMPNEQGKHVELPEPYVNSCLFARELRHLTGMARVLGKEEDARYYEDLTAKIHAAILEKYYDPQSGSFCDGFHAADAFALDLNIAPDGRTLENLVAKYTKNPVIDAGFLGTNLLLNVLFRYGQWDLAYRILNNDEKGTFLYQKNHGATTFWEYMAEPGFSNDHPMFGACAKYLFQGILGIAQTPGTCGYTSVIISPCLPEAMDFAEGAINVPTGMIKVKWTREGSGIQFHIDVPQAANAVLRYEGREWKLHGGDNHIEVETALEE